MTKSKKGKEAPPPPPPALTLALAHALKPTPGATALSFKADKKPLLHPNAARAVGVLVPKNFVYKKKRVKGLSSLKKKILLERLRRHKYLFEQSSPSVAPASTSIRIFHLTDGVDLDDADEMEEIVSNISFLASPFGDVRALSLWRNTGMEAYAEVCFGDAEAATKAAGTLDGFVLADTALRVSLGAGTALLEPSLTGCVDAPQVQPLEPAALLRLENVLQPEDLYCNEDELLEILSDVHSLSSGLPGVGAHIIGLRARRTHAKPSNSTEALLSSCRNDPSIPWVVLEATSGAAALQVIRSLDGRVVGGRALRCLLLAVQGSRAVAIPLKALCNTPPDVSVRCSDAVALRAALGLATEHPLDPSNSAPDHALLRRDSLDSALETLDLVGHVTSANVVHRDGQLCQPLQVVVSGYVDEDDLRELRRQGSSSDEVCALKEDLLALTGAAGAVSCVRMHPSLRHGEAMVQSAEELGEGDEEGDDGAREGGSAQDGANEDMLPREAGVVDVTFASLGACQRALVYLDGLVLGGAVVRATACAWRPADPLDPDVLAILLPTLAPPAQVGRASESCGPPAGFTCLLLRSGDAEAVSTAQVNDDSFDGGSSGCGGKYSSAQQMGRLCPHLLPPLTSVPVASEEVNASVRELLRLLASFQTRLREKHPLNYKKKLRFVCGLRQVTQSVKLGRAKLLLLAPNTEASDELDQRIGAAVAEAQVRDVPTLYALNKRQLGKALQMSMKQSAVAVLDPDGAYEHFRTILRFVIPR